MDFPVPLNEWFKTDLNNFIFDLFQMMVENERPYVNSDAIKKNFVEKSLFLEKHGGLLSLELWYQAFHDQAQKYRSMLDQENTCKRFKLYDKNEKIIITGGCGQIGSHIAELLLFKRGDQVLVIDNYATGRREHLPESHSGLTLVEGTIANKGLVDKITSEFRPDAIVHTAASYKDPEDWHNDTLTNCVGGANLVRASLDNDVNRFIYFQTALCYGLKPLEQPITLGHPKLPANSSYAISKTAAEDYIEISGLDYVTFRLANVIGPRNVSGPLPIFYQRISEGKSASSPPLAETSFLLVTWPRR